MFPEEYEDYVRKQLWLLTQYQFCVKSKQPFKAVTNCDCFDCTGVQITSVQLADNRELALEHYKAESSSSDYGTYTTTDTISSCSSTHVPDSDSAEEKLLEVN